MAKKWEEYFGTFFDKMRHSGLIQVKIKWHKWQGDMSFNRLSENRQQTVVLDG